MSRKNQNAQRTLKIFVNNMNSWLSNFIIEQFRTDHIPDAKLKYEFSGTLNEGEGIPLPRYFQPKIIKFDFAPSYKSEIFNNDIIVFNLNSGDFREIDYIIKGFRTMRVDSEKVIIVISSIMTWAKTPVKVKENETDEGEVYEEPQDEEEQKKEEEPKEDGEKNNENENLEEKKNENKQEEEEKTEEKKKEEEDKDKEKENIDNENEEKKENLVEEKKEKEVVVEEKPKTQYIYYTETEFAKRIPDNKYIQYKIIESQIIQLSQKNNIKSYVICPGFIYGYGEQFFYDIFKSFYLNKPPSPALSYLLTSNNTVPTIHVKDVVTLIKRLIERKPQHRYIFAFDQSPNRTIKHILKSIKKSIGCDNDENNQENVNNKSSYFTYLKLDLKAKPSNIFIDEKREGEDKEDYEKRAFKWHCQYGIAANASLIRREFFKYRGLKRNKVFILGNPYTGKSSLSSILSKTFKLKHLKLGDIITYGKEQMKDETLKKEINDKLAELESTLKEVEEAYNKRPNKKKTDPPFSSHQHMKLPIEIVSKIIRKKLLDDNDVFMNGYILDGYPRNYKEAQALFEIDESSGYNNKEKEEITSILSPNTVILINNVNEETAMNRVKESEEYVNDQNVTTERANRRLGKIKEIESEEGYKQLEEYFNEKGIKLCILDGMETLREIAKKSKEEIKENFGGKINVNRELMDCNDEEYDYEQECLAKEEEERKRIEEEEMKKKEEEEKKEKEKEKEKKEDKDKKDKDKEDKEKEKDDKKDKEELGSQVSKEQEESALKSNISISSAGDSKKEEENQPIAEQIEEIKPKSIFEREKEREFKLLEKKTEVLRRYLSENVLPVLSKGILEVCSHMPDDPVEALANYLLDNTFEKQLSLHQEQEETISNQEENGEQNQEKENTDNKKENEDNQNEESHKEEENKEKIQFEGLNLSDQQNFSGGVSENESEINVENKSHQQENKE